jgi:RIO kinase 1
MLCAGVVHGDLSEFNILLAHAGTDGEGVDGPVIIDLPQAVDAAGNNHAQRMLLRDVATCAIFLASLRPSCWPPTTAPRSGACIRPACCPTKPR